MFISSISWSQYAAVLVVALAVYYILFLLVFYRDEITTRRFKKTGEEEKNKLINNGTEVNPYERSDTFFQNLIVDDSRESKLIDEVDVGITPPHVSQPELFTSIQKYAPRQAEKTDDTLQKVQELTAALKEIIAQAVDRNLIKEEFIPSLQSLLKKYHFLKISPYLGLINNMIASECEKYGYIQLSAEERVMLWNE
jgi:hypothetical protein